MSVWLAEEVVKLGLRFCGRRFLWQQRSFLSAASIKGSSFSSQRLSHVWATRQSQTCLNRSPASSVRCYLQSEDLEEKEHLSLAESSLPAGIQSDGKATRQRQLRNYFWIQLKSCKSPSDVLDLVSQRAATGGEVSNCLTYMWTTTKKMSDEQRRYELQLMFEHPEFNVLLEKAMKNAAHMDNGDLAYSFLGMVKLGVPHHSRVIQTFLRTCQEKLNDFDEKSLSILASCLEHMQDSPNVAALREGMRLVVKTRLPRIKEVMSLQIMMRILGKEAPMELKQELTRKALSMADQFSLPNAQYMISTMATMGFYSKPLLNICNVKIRENLSEIPFNRLLTVLLSCKELHYRDGDLLSAISDHVSSMIDIWTRKQVLLLLSVYDSLAFCPTALMEVFAEQVIANPDALTLKDLLCVLKVYSSFNYDLQQRRQQFLDSLSRVLDSYLLKMSSFELLKVVFCLCRLGHFPSVPLQQLLESSTLEQLKPTDKTTTLRSRQIQRMFQTVHLCLTLDAPPLLQPLSVPLSFLGDPVPSSSANPRLLQGLRGLLEDQTGAALQETVVVENFYLLDGVITKAPPSRTSVTAASAGEQCSPAESSQRIAVLFTSQSRFCFATSKPRAYLAMKIRHLKNLGYHPVLVLEKELNDVPEGKTTEFLRGLIYPEHLKPDTQPETERQAS